MRRKCNKRLVDQLNSLRASSRGRQHPMNDGPTRHKGVPLLPAVEGRLVAGNEDDAKGSPLAIGAKRRCCDPWLPLPPPKLPNDIGDFIPRRHNDPSTSGIGGGG